MFSKDFAVDIIRIWNTTVATTTSMPFEGWKVKSWFLTSSVVKIYYWSALTKQVSITLWISQPWPMASWFLLANSVFYGIEAILVVNFSLIWVREDFVRHTYFYTNKLKMYHLNSYLWTVEKQCPCRLHFYLDAILGPTFDKLAWCQLLRSLHQCPRWHKDLS